MWPLTSALCAFSAGAAPASISDVAHRPHLGLTIR